MPLESINQGEFTKLIKILPENFRQAILQDTISNYDAALAKATLIFSIHVAEQHPVSQLSEPVNKCYR